MRYSKPQIAAKLVRWETFLNGFSLPDWDTLPQIPLYMDQVIALLSDYLSYFIYDGNDEKLITPAMVNNYVKMKLIPPPVRKRYGRAQLACLIMLCTLKQTLSMEFVRRVLPQGDDEAVRRDYNAFVRTHTRLSRYFTEQVRTSAAVVFDTSVDAGTEVSDLVVGAAVAASFAKLMASKIIALQLPEPAEPPAKPGKPRAPQEAAGPAAPADGAAARA